MRLAVLFSGGKDSVHAAYTMVQMGHQLTTLVSIVPSDDHSWVFHTPNLEFLPTMANAMGLPLVTEASTGEEKSDLKALYKALRGLDIDGVVMGAIASDYQWDRINQVCEELGLKTFSPLWRKDQSILMEDIVMSGIRSLLVRVSCEGMDDSWLGREINGHTLENMATLSNKYRFNLSGEGGEYETLVLDSPLHNQSLCISDLKKDISRDEGNLIIGKMILEGKNGS
ncbi:MAG: diphthine--ammonia ligase [Euryarchaeota archaeon]|nr:diphthine--ammonia ligase [Euryarchaeota archaeon]